MSGTYAHSLVIVLQVIGVDVTAGRRASAPTAVPLCQHSSAPLHNSLRRGEGKEKEKKGE
jgi:hypothetical protein